MRFTFSLNEKKSIELLPINSLNYSCIQTSLLEDNSVH